MEPIIEPVLEDTLPLEEAVLEDLTKEELLRVLTEKDKTIGYNESLIEKYRNELERISKVYEHDMKYMNALLENITKRATTKEDAVLSLLDSAKSLITLDRINVSPKEGDLKND